MAKISARGAKAVAEARRTGTTDDGTAETIRTLCSDGRILQRTTFRYHARGMRANSNGHVHYGTLRNPATPENVALWVALMTARKWSARVLYEGMEGARAMSTKTKTKKNAKTTAKSNGGFAAELEAQVAKMTKAGKATKHEVKDGMPSRRKATERIVSPDDLDQQQGMGPAEGGPAGLQAIGYTIPEMEHHEKVDLVTFAFRLPRLESEEIHRAAGPRNASKFVHAVALAAARGDLDTIKNVVEKVF
jgi:hypothetical protein